jgi:hypothetical protein
MLARAENTFRLKQRKHKVAIDGLLEERYEKQGNKTSQIKQFSGNLQSIQTPR